MEWSVCCFYSLCCSVTTLAPPSLPEGSHSYSSTIHGKNLIFCVATLCSSASREGQGQISHMVGSTQYSLWVFWGVNPRPIGLRSA